MSSDRQKPHNPQVFHPPLNSSRPCSCQTPPSPLHQNASFTESAFCLHFGDPPFRTDLLPNKSCPGSLLLMLRLLSSCPMVMMVVVAPSTLVTFSTMAAEGLPSISEGLSSASCRDCIKPLALALIPSPWA